MKVAVASGKGGTGKTTVAVHLALAAAQAGCAAAYCDCDVEEPNGRLFLHPDVEPPTPVERLLPVVDLTQCTFCGRCADVCRYGAIACVKQKVLIFAEVCHSCGGCRLACPAGAIEERPSPIGMLQTGNAGPIQFVEGRLNVGEASCPPVIRAVKAATVATDLTILDCPPGASCPTMEAIRGSDLALLVTEPTPFGLNDLELAVEMTRALKTPLAVAINRCDIGDDRVTRYCERERIDILAEIADDRAVAEAYSRGISAADASPAFASQIQALFRKIQAYGE